MIKVRFAPSPTGFLHIGGARTCLFNWLYAKAKNGKFILRIEDTDIRRSKKEFLDEILESIKWLGMDWDEIYFQSQRLSLYKEFAEKLLRENKAYQEENKAVVFKVEPHKIKIKDLIHGEIEFDTSVIKDQVLIKADGTPTYNFACVVDDATLGITHVIRGDDHISNTPKQILLYQALGFLSPEFAHIPLILSKEGGRLSKRKGATSISEFRQMGYLPEALVNYLLLLSWSPGENRELIDIEEAINLFDIKDVNKTSAVFDMDKLNWINSQYIRKQDPNELVDIVTPLLIEKGFVKRENLNREYILNVVKLFQNRISTLAEFIEWADFFFKDEIEPEPQAKEKFLNKDLSKEFSLFLNRLAQLKEFNPQTIEMEFRQLVKDLNLEARQLVHPVRVALTGKTVGPGLFELIYYLGKERTIQRIKKWIKR
ncbi:MAG: glutamate--tRNA ligase [Candidatus Omnitrophica bacterium]|nr:glutamate--tRNA ligase [Candidatus Omnitrophota bacterium]MCM8799866.1 glutamate--tRNA ligase [Candidatus Omnitrophota bacterium]